MIAKQVLDAGISANLSVGAVYFDSPETFSPDKCEDCGNHIRLYEDWHNAGDGQIASPSPVAEARERSSQRSSAGKMKSWSQLCRSCPPPYPRLRGLVLACLEKL